VAKKGFVIKGPYISINGVDLSDWVKSIELPIEVAEVDATTGTAAASAANAAMGRLAGLKDWSFSPTFAQDFAANAVDATLYPLIGTEFAVEIRPTNAAASATNPKFTGNGMLFGYEPINGAIGAHAETKPTIKCSDGAALARATS
jgi:hypothetical protein